ncbi:phytase [Lysobacter helvus]|uniref:Phytase n=3 Tax=Lysobacterales TaxID=135614 RepID=A0ABM7Q614_9GAMM|nr:phytase [Lysobacter caseinilyticus]BCT95951.1 phytase [Lysobacter helvus]
MNGRIRAAAVASAARRFAPEYIGRLLPHTLRMPIRHRANSAPRLLALTLAIALLGACATTSTPAPEAPAPKPALVAPPQPVTVPEAYVSAEMPEEELDSLATWPGADGLNWLIATGKSGHNLVIFDAEDGTRLRTFGSEGTGPGQFDRPNGIAVYADYVFVVERDNHRVQVLQLPDFKFVGFFGEKELRSPYGLWVNETEPGELEVYVTDSFMYGKKFDEVPPFAELDQRVRRYRVQFDQAGRLRANYGGAFGDTREAYALRMVESIAGDRANDRLLVADEDQRHESTLREYTFSGKYTGRSLPQDSFGAEAEGVALWTCPDGGGYWIAVDQLAPLTLFHVFDRVTLQPRGTFQGNTTSHTDGVALHAASMPHFPGGALFAVHDDKAVTAFDLRDVATALGLARDCVD